VGERLPSIAKLAQTLGTGQRNTHRAVQLLTAEGILSTRAGSGTYVRRLGDPDSSAAASPRPLTGKKIAILHHPGQTDPLILLMGEQAKAVLAEQGATLVDEDVDRMRAMEYDFSHLTHDGAVLLNPSYATTVKVRPQMKLVVISTRSVHPAQSAAGFDVVAADDEAGALLAGRALRDAGCQSACFLGVVSKPQRVAFDLTSAQRRQGFEQGWGEPLPDACCLQGTSYMQSVGARLVAQFLALKPRPQGVFAASDELAIGFRLGMLSAGLEAGRDYQLIGFDGQDEALRNPDGPLTTIAVPAAEMGRTAAQLLRQRLEQPDRPARRVLVNCQLCPGVTLRPSASR
jgi:DNA-binding LacI/PurR family transcriptional regulator